MTDEADRAARMVEEKLAPKVELADAQPPALSDEALALQFARRFADEMRYVAAWKHWHSWTGATWALDTTLDVLDRIRAICRVAASEADKWTIQTRVASAKMAKAVEHLAKADRRIAATVDQWDADPDTFNTEGEDHDC